MGGIPGVPLRMLLDCVSHTVIVELINGNIFRGKMGHTDQFMNLCLVNVTHKSTVGEVKTISETYIRSSLLRCIFLPHQMKSAPILKGVTKLAQAGICEERVSIVIIIPGWIC